MHESNPTEASSSATRSAALPYQTGWVANSLSWSNREDIPFRFAVGSFTQEYQNTIDIVQKYENDLVCRASFAHCYPPTKLMFSPAKTSSGSDLLISTADYLRLWEVKECVEGKDMKEKDLPENQEAPEGKGKTSGDDETTAAAPVETDPAVIERNKKATINSQVTMKKMFDSGKPNDFCSPITSCDWNADDPEVVGCCSIDTTVTIWNIEQGVHTMQLIAHDKEVYDIAFAKGTHTFASCGADGSVRIFDLRDMEHCTIVYEAPAPLLRVAWNKHDQSYLSTFGINGTDVVIIDIRYPTVPVATLTQGHNDAINCINWAPHSSQYLCSGGEDCTANIWDLSNTPKEQPSRYLTYDAPAPINNISWSAQHEEYICITAGEQAQLLKI